ncbi:MAG: hypothetical protein ACXVO9_07585 [Bacteroidia bacterium]
MKSIILSFGIFLISLSLNANLGAGSDVNNKIKQAVTMPASLKQKHRSEKITVTFVVNESGKVIEVSAKTNDKEAKRDIENQFINLKFDGLKPCVMNTIDINFLLF